MSEFLLAAAIGFNFGAIISLLSAISGRKYKTISKKWQNNLSERSSYWLRSI